jgi:hypothetical protein
MVGSIVPPGGGGACDPEAGGDGGAVCANASTPKSDKKNPTAANARDAIVFLTLQAGRRHECRRRFRRSGSNGSHNATLV